MNKTKKQWLKWKQIKINLLLLHLQTSCLLFALGALVINTASYHKNILLRVEYCDLWKLHVNIEKINALIFRKLIFQENIYYKGMYLLNLWMISNILVLLCLVVDLLKEQIQKKSLTEKASKASNGVVRKISYLDLPIDFNFIS